MTRRLAYRTLGLEVGASLDEVEEAFSELYAVWDPARFEDDPALQEKAKRKRSELEAARQLIQRLSGSPDESRQDLYKAIYASGSSRPKRDDPFEDEPEDDGSPSLLSDTFSASRHRRRPAVPMWAVGTAVFAVVIAIIFLSRPDGESQTSLVPVPVPLPEVVEPITSETTAESVAAKETPPPPAPPTPAPDRAAVRPRPATERPPVSRQPTVAARSEERPEPSGPRPRLIRGPAEAVEPPSTATSPNGAPEAEATEQGETIPEVDAEAQSAFDTLRNNSDAALRLVGDLVEGLTFKEWRLAGKRGETLLIDVVAVDAQGNELHLVWGVNSSDGGIRALSQAARDLESRLTTPPSPSSKFQVPPNACNGAERRKSPVPELLLSC